MDGLLGSALVASGLWGILWGLPGRPWAAREHLEATYFPPETSLDDITAVVPARNEADCIERGIRSLKVQGQGLRIVVVDDNSTDGTAEVARRAGGEAVEVVSAPPPPPGWQGKLWALEQGTRRVRTPYLLLLDADIELLPGLVPTLRRKLQSGERHLVSLMVQLRMVTAWERLLLPAFVFFFKLIYPFAWVNRSAAKTAAAAGGCILMETQALANIGGFASIKGAVIDDCSLARRIKEQGHGLWLGLTRSAWSNRAYHRLSGIWEMIARTAFSQLRYSFPLLGGVSLLMLLAFWGPPLALVVGSGWQRAIGALGFGIMALVYAPTLRFYGFWAGRSLGLPLASTLFLVMTWASAWRYTRGLRTRWKGRDYGRETEGANSGEDR